MKKNKEKEKNTNPYHKEYGVFSNSIHALKSMLSYSHRFIPVIIISVVCAPIMQYLWSFISKFVIDMITTGQSVTALALLMGGFTVIQITATMLNLYGNSFFHIYIGARFRQMGLKNRKIMSVDYGYLEDKDFMDCYQKAGNACNSNNEGIEGMMRGIVRLLTLIPIIVVGIAILGTMNIFIVIAILICSVLQFVVTNKTNAYCKKKVWDPLAPWWRRHNYLSYTTSDFEAAKDIRMFGIADWPYRKVQSAEQRALCGSEEKFKDMGGVGCHKCCTMGRSAGGGLRMALVQRCNPKYDDRQFHFVPCIVNDIL